MIRRITICLLAALLVLPVLSYGEEANQAPAKFKAEFSAGYHGYATDDSKRRVAEYESVDSSPNFGLRVEGSNENLYLDLTGNYKDNDDLYTGADLDLSRIFRVNLSYDRFIHRLDHDEFYKPYIKKSQTLSDPQFKIPVGINNDPSDPQPDSYKFVDYPGYDDVVAWETHGPKAFRYTDLDFGKDYMYRIKRFGSDFKLQLPFFPNIIVHGGYHYTNKKGNRQVMTMSHCASCHIVSQAQMVNQTTQIYKGGVTFIHGPLTLDFTHKTKVFRRSDETMHNFYELSHHPPAYDPQYGGTAAPPPGGEEGTFGNRLNYQYESLPFARVPETDKNTETVKARLAIFKDAYLTGMYVYSKTTDKDRTEALDHDIDQTYQSAMGRITFHPVKHMTVTAGVKYYTIDADDIKVKDAGGAPNPPDSLLPNAGSHWGYDGYINAAPDTNFGYNRKSAAERDVTEFDISANYNFNTYVTTRLEYRLKLVDRENKLQYWENRAAFTDEYNKIALDNTDDLINPVPADYHLDKYDYGDPTIHTIDGTIYFYPMANLNGRFSFTYEHNDDPFEYPHAKGEKDKVLQSALSPNFCFPADGSCQYPNTCNPTCSPPGCVCTHGASSLDIGDSSNYADFFIPMNRIQEGTNQPSDTYKAELSFNWSPIPTASIAPMISYTHQDNDDTPWESQQFNAGISTWWSPVEKLTLSLAYNFYHEKTTTDYWFTFFNG